MDAQLFIDILLGLVAFFGSWAVKNLNESLKLQRESGVKLTEKVQAIEVLVAGEYVKKEELKAIFDLLQRIDDKLEKKADK